MLRGSDAYVGQARYDSTRFIRLALSAAVPYASNGKPRKTTLYAPAVTVSASGADVSSVKAAVAGAISVTSSSYDEPSTEWSSGIEPMPSLTALPDTPCTFAVGLSFCVSEPSQLMCR